MKSKNKLLIGLVVLSISAGGCLRSPGSMGITEVSPGSLTQGYLRKARDHEKLAELTEALKQYKLALSVSPSNSQAFEGRKRVEKALRGSAESHYKRGLRFHKQGRYGQARRQFLIALRLRPDYPEVVNMLTSRARLKIDSYVVHKIKSGESLSMVAKRYYGDPNKFAIIAKYNNISNATRVKVGQSIKIPELDGIKLLEGRRHVKTKEQIILDQGFWDWEESLPRKDGQSAIALYRQRGKEHFRSKRYEETMVELQKVLNIYPDDEVARDYFYQSNFQIGLNLFKKKDYVSAKYRFEEALQYNVGCSECHSYIKKSENFYKENHYKKGMQYYGKERLLEAINEWEMVRLIDPNYKRVEYLIEKAKTILKNLKQIKGSKR